MSLSDWNSVEWILESCLMEPGYDPASASFEAQENLRKEMLPRMSGYLADLEIDEHLAPDYAPEILFTPRDAEVSFDRLIRFLPYPCHASQWYEIFFVEEGSTTHFVREKAVRLHAGDVMVIPPGTPHLPAMLNREVSEYRINLRAGRVAGAFKHLKRSGETGEFFERTRNAEAASGYLIFRTDQGAEEAAGEHAQNKDGFSGKRTQDKKSDLSLLYRLLETEDADTPEGKNLTPVLLEAALLELDRRRQKEIELTVEEESISKQLVRYIDRHFYDVSVSDLKEVFLLTESQIYRNLMDECGKSFTDYRMEARLNYICDMLKHTKVPVVDVITSSGFHHNAFFYTFFTERFHMTPTEYREKG